MKISKSDLKTIIKECLLEILNEGLGSTAAQLENKQTSVTKQLFTNNSRSQSMNSSNRNYSNDMHRASPQLKNAIMESAGGNKIMESILADTAASTLPKMIQNDSKSTPLQVPGGLAEQVVAHASPEELFGSEISGKWANLAFSGLNTKK